MPLKYLILSFLITTSAYSFFEDLCYVPNNGWKNCLEAMGCTQESIVKGTCRIAVLADVVAMRGIAARSVVHVDSTYFIALSVGIRPDIAYWIAAYDEATDLGSYTAMDINGQPYNPDRMNKYQTVSIKGVTRNSAITGGFGYHQGAIFNKRSVVSPDAPRLDDPIEEGMLFRLRQWGLLEKLPGCIDGVAKYDPATGSYFTNAECFQQAVPLTPWFSFTVPTLTGLLGTGLSTITLQSYAGQKIIDYKGGGQNPMTDIILDTQLSSYLASKTPTVPASVARMGMYLHMLQDRISHGDCVTESTVSPTGNSQMSFRYDSEECTQDLHIYGHYQEVGWGTLPTRTISALQYTFDELSLWLSRHPEYAGAGQKKLSQTDVIHSLKTSLSEKNACLRLKKLTQATTAQGYPAMPGLSNVSALCGN